AAERHAVRCNMAGENFRQAALQGKLCLAKGPPRVMDGSEVVGTPSPTTSHHFAYLPAFVHGAPGLNEVYSDKKETFEREAAGYEAILRARQGLLGGDAEEGGKGEGGKGGEEGGIGKTGGAGMDMFGDEDDDEGGMIKRAMVKGKGGRRKVRARRQREGQKGKEGRRGEGRGKQGVRGAEHRATAVATSLTRPVGECVPALTEALRPLAPRVDCSNQPCMRAHGAHITCLSPHGSTRRYRFNEATGEYEVLPGDATQGGASGGAAGTNGKVGGGEDADAGEAAGGSAAKGAGGDEAGGDEAGGDADDAKAEGGGLAGEGRACEDVAHTEDGTTTTAAAAAGDG
ncbi:unnamed protein product, partial [Closterium sp. Yama58-4]